MSRRESTAQGAHLEDVITMPPPAVLKQSSFLSKQTVYRLASLDAFLESKSAKDKLLLSRASTKDSMASTVVSVDESKASTRFRSKAAEFGFCVSMAVTQLLAASLPPPLGADIADSITGVPHLGIHRPAPQCHGSVLVSKQHDF